MYTLLALTALLFSLAYAQDLASADAFAADYAKAYADAYVAAERAYLDAETTVATLQGDGDGDDAFGTFDTTLATVDEDEALGLSDNTLTSDLALSSDPNLAADGTTVPWNGPQASSGTSACMLICGCTSWSSAARIDHIYAGKTPIHINCNRMCSDMCCGIGNWDILGRNCITPAPASKWRDDPAKMDAFGCTDFCKWQADTEYIQRSCYSAGRNSQDLYQRCLYGIGGVGGELSYGQQCRSSYTPHLNPEAYPNVKRWCSSRKYLFQQYGVTILSTQVQQPVVQQPTIQQQPTVQTRTTRQTRRTNSILPRDRRY